MSLVLCSGICCLSKINAQNACGNATPELIQKLANLEAQVGVEPRAAVNIAAIKEGGNCFFRVYANLTEPIYKQPTVGVALADHELKKKTITDDIGKSLGYGWSCLPDKGHAQTAAWCSRTDGVSFILLIENGTGISELSFSSWKWMNPESLHQLAWTVADESVLVHNAPRPLPQIPAIQDGLSPQGLDSGLWTATVHVGGSSPSFDVAYDSCILDGGKDLATFCLTI